MRRLALIGMAMVLVAVVRTEVGAGARAVSPAPVSVSAAVSTQALSAASMHEFTLTVTIVNTGPQTQVAIELGSHPWPHAGATAGSPLQYASPTVSAPATFTPFPPPPVPAPMPWGCVRGVQDYGEGGTVSVPAQTTATMTVAVRTVVPAWPHTDYTPVVTWSGRTVDVPPIRVAGPTGVHIVVRAGTDHLPAGASLTLRGATAPPLRRRVVSLSAAAFTWTDLNAPPRIVLRRRVRTDRSGRFVMRGLRPAISGMYQFRARVVHPGPGLAPDRSCGPVIRVNPGRIGGLP